MRAEHHPQVVQSLGFGQLHGQAGVRDQPPAVGLAELVGDLGAGSQVGQCLFGEAGPAGCAESPVHGDRAAQVDVGVGVVAHGGGEHAEVVVDGGVVGRASGDDDVGAGVRAQLLVGPPALFRGPDGGEDDGGHGQGLETGRMP